MIQCPRCQNSVDETKQAACPVCLTPLAASSAQPGPAMPGFNPLPGSGATPPGRPPQVSAPIAPYAPPPGSPYASSPSTAYTPPPGSPYPLPPLPGPAPLPPTMAPPPVPGYAPVVTTRTTLTGEVVETSAPAPLYTPTYPQGGYAPPPGPAPYGHGVPYPPQPASPPNRGWSAMNWRLAGGGTLTALYIAARLLLIFARSTHPFTSTNSYSPTPPAYFSAERRSFPSAAPTAPMPYRYTMPTMPQPRVYTPPNLPARPNFPSHFQPPNMPPMPIPPHGFSGPYGLPGRGSFGMPVGGRFGRP